MKTPVPFPLSLQIGTDIVHLPRITRLLARPHYLNRFTRRILSNPEQRDFRTRFNLRSDFSRITDTSTNTDTRGAVDLKGSHSSLGSGSAGRTKVTVTPDMARWLAGRFAAKEAGRKAARGGAKVVGWRDVVVRVPVPTSDKNKNKHARENGNEKQDENDGENEEEGGIEGAEGRPEVILYDKNRRGRMGRLSISHDGEYVVATVLAAG
ncbi:uncharacterized protein BDV17DRAFT_194298 [Aspergillus undulatus]|uniref:uncharacterized protein n=1 Tax=Aspergillus undulatus TaxID=1810928 RepID=UPI003CCD7604